jgi:diacylglycerol kinase
MKTGKNRSLIESFKAAFDGFRESLIFERSFRIMLVIALGATLVMIYLPTSKLEKIALLSAIFAVLILELINAAVERILNLVSPHYSEEVRIIKDLMAAIVLLASIGAAVVGLLIFTPYIF